MLTLDDVCCACLPAAALPLLAGLRTLPGLRAWPRGDWVWLRWEPGRDEVLRRLLPIEGVELFGERGGLWYRPGRALPVFTVPEETENQPLAGLLVPDRWEPEPPASATVVPVSVRLVRDEQPRPALALCCTPAELARWAEYATTWQLSAVNAGHAGDKVLIRLGFDRTSNKARLPIVPDAQRYWGQRVLVPLGWRLEPLLSEDSLAEAFGLTPEEIALVHDDGIDVVPLEALTPLTRAGARLLAQGGRHGPG